MYIDETLHTGRPAERRTAREERCYELLDRLAIPYYRVDHDPADTIADCELVEGLLGLSPGSVSVLGLMNDTAGAVRLLMDRDLLREESFGCHPCLNSTSLRFSTGDLLERLLPALGHAPEFVDLPWTPEDGT